MDILTTKLFIPTLRPALVARPRLLRKLDQGVQQRRCLTLVSAPAGYGKTTLIAEWTNRMAESQQSQHLGWLSLDEEDNDPDRFLSYLLAALRQTGLALTTTEQYLQSLSQLPPPQTLVTMLLNEISQASNGRSLLLVLDDYHKIQTAVIHETLQFWLDHAPPHLHLVLITREDPPLTLARWRARSQMTEIRASDLRFTLAEAADFLNRTMGLSLTAGDIAALEQRTEGWIASLQLAATRKMLGGMEEHFVVVNWEQPGAGKSYRAADFSSLTPEQYIADGHELTLYLLERFDEEKIYIMGESWGTLLGLWLVQEHPERYHAFAGVAQMVDFLETDTYDYNLALEIAAERGDTNTLDALQQQGPPPYYGDGVALKVTRYVMYLSSYMMQNPAITGPGYDTFGDIGAPEYGLYDKVNYFWGLLRTMETLWPQLWDVDMRQQVPQVDVPVYFMEGRHDVNAPPALAEDYLQKLEAPHKELIWFEHSGHSPWVDEADKMVDVMVNTVLANTTP